MISRYFMLFFRCCCKKNFLKFPKKALSMAIQCDSSPVSFLTCFVMFYLAELSQIRPNSGKIPCSINMKKDSVRPLSKRLNAIFIKISWKNLILMVFQTISAISAYKSSRRKDWPPLNGNSISTRQPSPGRPLTVILPPCSRTMDSQMLTPIPLPCGLVV